MKFNYRRRLVAGVIIRTNPRRAVVRVDGEEFAVPYDLLFPMVGNIEEREQQMESVQQLARQLMAEHGLTSWRFKFDHSTRRAGCCYFRDKLISIAFEHARTGSDEEVRDTLLHEIAHALVGKKHNHDAVWKAKAREIGCSGERTHQLQFAPPRWTVTCQNRCWTHTAQQRNSRLICRKCGSKLVYTPYSAPA
ncbi:SprT-like domain-containing protein [Pontiellaceae bacterium B1224]|nr:SprT-like domain-containing protein [Pontiellaceae bacterium B1224]